MKKNRFFTCVLALTFFYITNASAAEAEIGDPVQTGFDDPLQLVSEQWPNLSAVVQTQMEIEVFNLINQSRVANLLPPLVWSDAVATQARNHTLDMANNIVPFGHDGSSTRFANLQVLIPHLTRFGENVEYNRGYPNPPQTAVTGWLNSPGHYANIMGDFNLTGVGGALDLRGRYYFTQIFVKQTASLVQNFDPNQDQEMEEVFVQYFSVPQEAVFKIPYLSELD